MYNLIYIEMYLNRHIFQNIYKWNRCVQKRFCGDTAAELGYLIHLREPYVQLRYTVDAINNAAYCGHLDVVKWLHHNRTEGCTTWAMDFAAGNGHLNMMKWLHYNRTEGCTDGAMDFAASNGHLEIVKWLHENRTEGCTTWAMDYAAMNGHLDVVKWLHENRTEGCTDDAMDSAAWTGKLDVMRWLHENRTEGCTTEAVNSAVERVQLEPHPYTEILDWLEENYPQIVDEWETQFSNPVWRLKQW